MGNSENSREPKKTINISDSLTFEDSKTSISDINELFGYLEREKKNIAVYFHGGAVPYEKGKKSAERMNKVFNDGKNYTRFFPISFIWESGIWEHIFTPQKLKEKGDFNLSEKSREIRENDSLKNIRYILKVPILNVTKSDFESGLKKHLDMA